MIKITATATATATADAILSGFSWYKTAPADAVKKTAPADAVKKTAPADAAPSKGVQAIVSEFIENQFDDVDYPLVVADADLFSLIVDTDI